MVLEVKLQFADVLASNHPSNLEDTSSLDAEQEENSSNIHYLPFSVGGSVNKSKSNSAKLEESKTEAARYFKQHKTENNDSQTKQGRTASFRGYPLLGENIKIPRGYTAVTLKESGVSAQDEQVLRENKRFHDLCYWNMDRKPSLNDKFQKALNWIEQSEVIHGN